MKKTDLRQQAEAKLSKRKKTPVTETDSMRLIHELEVHQIELEMQNEELVQARAEAEAVHRQYIDLYDFAPLGYFTLTRDGTIQMSNLMGAKLLGAERSKLVKRRFGVFVSVESRPAFSAFLEKIFTTENNESCEITLLREGHESCWVHLDAVCSEDRLECRIVMNDITRRKQAEIELIQGEAKFRSTFDQSPVGSVIVGLDKHFIRCNSAFCNFLGYPESELIGKTISDISHPEDLEIGMKELKQMVEGKIESYTKQKRYLRKDGSIVWGEISIRLVRDANNEPLYFLPIIQNITKRKQAEEALCASEEKYRQIVEMAREGIWMIDTEGNTTFANQKMAEMLGFSVGDMLGVSFFNFMDEDGKAIADANLERRRQGINEQHDFKFRRKDGANLWAILETNPILDRDGRYAGALAMITDITERKQIEDTLMFLLQSGYRDEDFFHSLARHLTSSLSMDYVCIDRLAGDQLSAQTLAVYFDGKFDDNVSYTLKDTPCGDVVGKAVCIFPSQVRHLFPLDVVLQEMPAESYVGSTLWSSQGTPIGLIAVIGRKPLSAASQRMAESILKLVAVRAAGELERQQAEEEIRQLNVNLEQRVEERTRELRDAQEKLVRHGKLTVMGELAGSVGHELRNPLSVINSAVYYLKMVQPDATDEMKQYLDMIGQEVWNAEKIIDNLLDFGRAISADLEVVPVSKLVDQTLEKIAPLESVKVTLDIPTDLPKVYVDPRQMMQVFSNLIVNACQAMTATSGAGGKLTISAALQGSMVRVDICDNGIGIPSENLHKIFDPLFTTKAKGIGLGLALSKKLIEANHTRIEVESEAGKGSTFIVYLPVYEK